MELINVERIGDTAQDKKLAKAYARFEQLISEIQHKDLPQELAEKINRETRELNTFEGSSKELRKHIEKAKDRIVVLLKNTLGIVPSGYYKAYWMSMGVFVGFMIGALIGFLTGDITDMDSLIDSITDLDSVGIGLPLGVLPAYIYGHFADKKAYKEGRELNVESGRALP